MTGPSGAGKGTLIRELLARRDDVELAVSATTRPRRPGEIDGVHYYFLTDEEFDRRVAAGEFDYIVANDELQRAVDRLTEIVVRELAGKLPAR